MVQIQPLLARTLLRRGPLPARWLRALAGVALCTFLAACGFHLKGATPLPFDTLYTNIAENSEFGARIRRAVMASSPNTRFVETANGAQARLIQLSDRQWLRELSIDANGQVDEYELNLAFSFQLTDAKGHLLLAPTTIRSSVDLPYDPTQIQAGAGEIGAQFKDMRDRLVDQIVRRLTSPEVIKAYQNAESLPVDENPANTAPLQPGTGNNVPTPWSNSNAAQTGAF
jgi:LPS-assembly lipoprotein